MSNIRKRASPKHKKSFSPPLARFFNFLDTLGNNFENLRSFILHRPIILALRQREKPPFKRRYVITILIMGIAIILRHFIQSNTSEDVTFNKNISVVVFLSAVIGSAWYGGLGTGLFATFLSVIAGVLINYNDDLSMNITTGKDQIRMVIFVLFGILVSSLYETVQTAVRWQSIILESISDIFITFDRNMRVVYINKKAEEILRVKRRNFLGKKFLKIYPEAKKNVFYKNCQISLKKQKRIQFEMRLPEDQRWYSVSLYPSIDGVSAYFQDITRRKGIEHRLKESQLRFRRLFDANIIGIFVANAEGKVFQANDVFLHTIGYTRTDLQKNRINWKKMTPLEYQEISDSTNAEVLKKGMAPPFEKEYIRKDGTRVAILMGKVLLDKKTRAILAFNLDISEQKNLEKKKNEFLSIASHELKTPLTTIKAFTQMLIKQKSEIKDKRTQYFLSNIDHQVDKLNSLISDLLDVSKIEAGKLSFQLKDFVLGDLVKKVVIDSHYTIQSHTIIKEGESSSLVSGDSHRIEQVLINLISNAVKYSPHADKVIVRVKNKKNEVIVSIVDFGIGIDKSDQKKIFERFFRSEKHSISDVTGFGLGLYICKEIIDRHGGKIFVESQLGKGSTFTISLPIIQQNGRTRR